MLVKLPLSGIPPLSQERSCMKQRGRSMSANCSTCGRVSRVLQIERSGAQAYVVPCLALGQFG